MEKLVNGNVELVSWCWYNSREIVGIVIGFDTVTQEKKAYIGAAVGDNERHDIFNIMCWGAKFDLKCAEKLIKQRGFKI